MLLEFFEAVLPSTGHYCLFNLGTKQHTWSPSLPRLAQRVEDRIDAQGTYFATASFNEATQRTQTNVLALRALRLDIDAGAKKYEKNPDGAYPTQHDALADLISVSKELELLPSYIVSSGEGLHVYYALDADASPEQWRPLAARLGEAMHERNLKVDNTVTTDTARVLRPPGTLHPNGSRVTILKATGVVYTLENLGRLLPLSVEMQHQAVPAITAPARARDPRLAADVAPPPRPKTIHKIIAHCAAMGEVARTRGDVPEPFWRAAIGIAKFTVEGADAAHSISDGYDGYDIAETQAKFDNWRTGPSTCAEFGKHTRVCLTCKHYGKITSPAELGYMTEDQVAELPPEQQPVAVVAAPPVPTGDPWDGQMPPGFVVTRNPEGRLTVVYTMLVPKEDAAGDTIMVPVQVPFTHTVFWLTQWAGAENTDDSAQSVMCVWNDKHKYTKMFTTELSWSANRLKLTEELAKKEVVLTSHKRAGQAVDDFYRAQLHRVQMMSQRPKITERFGMRILHDGQLVCAHGKHVLYPDGSIQEGMLSKELREASELFPIRALPDLGLGEWPAAVWDDHIRPAAKQYVDFLNVHFSAPDLSKHRMALMLGLASPLMAFVKGSYHSGIKLPPNGLSVSLYARHGGEGKTSLVQAIMLAYGNPDELAKDANESGSTDIARLSKLSLWGTMPMSMEEMGNTKETSIAKLISSVANGTGRTRATRGGGLTQSAPWALVNFITTNRAQRDMVTAAQEESAAIQNRLIELNVENVSFGQAARDAYVTDWASVQNKCAGALGAVIEYALCRMGTATLNAQVVKAVSKASALLSAEQDARFQYRALGAMMLVSVILQAEGMPLFSLQGLVDEFKAAHTSGKEYIAENVLPTKGEDLAVLMLGDLRPHTIITLGETNRGLEPNKMDVPLNTRMPEVVKARHVATLGYTWVASHAVREWALGRKVSESDMLKDCKTAGVLQPPNKSAPTKWTAQIDLFKGLKDSADARNSCYKFSTRVLKVLTGGDWDETGPGGANVLPIALKAKPVDEESAQPLENQA